MKKDIDNKETENSTGKFTEQEAPEKNTDNAFVKVGRDGQPEIPDTGKEDGEEDKGSLRHR